VGKTRETEKKSIIQKKIKTIEEKQEGTEHKAKDGRERAVGRREK
jgi:hypothetical protein